MCDLCILYVRESTNTNTRTHVFASQLNIQYRYIAIFLFRIKQQHYHLFITFIIKLDSIKPIRKSPQIV